MLTPMQRLWKWEQMLITENTDVNTDAETVEVGTDADNQ